MVRPLIKKQTHYPKKKTKDQMKKNIEKAVEMVKAGSTCIEAAERCKVSVSGVTAACHRLGVSVNARGARKREVPKRGSSIAKALTLVKNGASIPKAAKKVGISHQAIYAAIKRYEGDELAAEKAVKKPKKEPPKTKKPTVVAPAKKSGKTNGKVNGVPETALETVLEEPKLLTDEEIEEIAKDVDDDEYVKDIGEDDDDELFEDADIDDTVDPDELTDEL